MGADLVTRKFSYASTMKPTQTVLAGTNYLKYFFALWNPNSSSGVASIPEFRMWAGMYDRFRVTGVKIRVTPRIDSINQMAVTASASNTANDGAGVYYVVKDRDSSAPSSIPQIRRYKNTRVYKETKPCTASYNIKFPKGFWLDTNADYAPGSGTQGQTMMNQIGGAGGITVYAENILEKAGQIVNYTWADVEVTWTCAFQCYNPRTITVVDKVVSLAPRNEDVDGDKVVQLLEDITGEAPPAPE